MKSMSSSGTVMPKCMDNSSITLDDAVMDALLMPDQYFYQPIIDIINETVVGFEMLSRAKIKGIQDRVNISTLFQSLTARTRFNFDLFSIKHAIALIRKNSDKAFYLSVNVEPEHIYNECFISHIERLLSDENVDNVHHRIVLEITERSELRCSKSTIDNLNVLVSLGFCLSIDDFGTGFSNLALFTWINVDYIKIDGIFIDKLGTKDENPEILKAIKVLSQGVGATLVGERIETQQQLDILKENGVQFCQGYYLGKPKPTLMASYKIA